MSDEEFMVPCAHCKWYPHRDSQFEPSHISKDELKIAIKEWMDERFAAFGKWTMLTAGVMLFGWLVYGLLTINGWHK